jgi:hypothetical protein
MFLASASWATIPAIRNFFLAGTTKTGFEAEVQQEMERRLRS